MNSKSSEITSQKLSLPKGGGAMYGLGGNVRNDEFTGTASLSVPLHVSPCRDFSPSVSIDYSSGQGNGPWGLGFSASLPAISRKTNLGIPQYNDTDVFTLSGEDYLVPIDKGSRQETLQNITYQVQSYRPCVDQSYEIIEYWQPKTKGTAGFWRTITQSHVVSIFGFSSQAQIADPSETSHVFQWLLEESYDDKGQHELYFYKAEDTVNISTASYETNRTQTANRYPQFIRYGNSKPLSGAMVLTGNSAIKDPSQWLFEIVFDYGEYNIDPSNINPYNPAEDWTSRPDAFSSYNSGFEIRTHRRCLHVMMFHRFSELSSGPVMVHTTQFDYANNFAGLSQIQSIQETGYHYENNTSGNGTYQTQPIPPLELKYTTFQPKNFKFEQLQEFGEQPLVSLGNSPNYSFVDLYGEGLTGVFYADGETTFYQEPELKPKKSPSGKTSSETKLPPEAVSIPPIHTSIGFSESEQLPFFPIAKNVNTPNAALEDITGNGQKDMVLTGSGLNGFYEVQTDHSWILYQPFVHMPSDSKQAGQFKTDLTGDGLADLVMLNNEEMRVYPSTGAVGYGTALSQTVPDSLPNSLDSSASETEKILFADIAGAGTPQVVRIRNGKVVYWPSLGYGRFGEAVTMANGPSFGANFNTNQLFLADLDGSGTDDLIYMETNKAIVYFNQSGNTFSGPHEISLPDAYDNVDQIDFADVYGTGTMCMVLSYLHGPSGPQFQCCDLSQRQKPYLLNHTDNNTGGVIDIEYRSSVSYYLEDKQAGLPWITILPFPVQVVAQVIATDQLTGTQLTSQYAYHHGYYDGIDREFRGFGRVDRQDAEYFPKTDSQEENALGDANYVAPSASRTWYHTGASDKEDTALSKQYVSEYNQSDSEAFELPDSNMNWGSEEKQMNAETRRQAWRALKSSVLRSEVYGLDGGDQAQYPYSVSESNYSLILKQPMGSNPYAIYELHPRETLDYDYERNPQDPNIHHQFQLEVDDYGNVIQSCQVAYGRRSTAKGVLPEQQQLQVTFSVADYFNQPSPDTFLAGVPTEEQHFQLHGLSAPQNAALSFDTVIQAIAKALKTITGSSSSSDQALLLSWGKYYYAEVTYNNTQGMPWRKVGLPLLPWQVQTAEITYTQAKNAFQGVLAGDELTQMLQAGYYQNDEEAGIWWNPQNTAYYQGVEDFYLPQKMVDPAGHETTYAYDTHHLLLNQVTDALGNVIKVQTIDYQVLAPQQLLDINGNTTEACFDPLGRVVQTSMYGHENGQSIGFSPLSEVPWQMPESLSSLLEKQETYLGKAQSYYYYDLFAWKDRQEPLFDVLLQATDYPRSPSDDEASVIQVVLAYSDGFSRELQSKMSVEPGESYLYDSSSKSLSQGNTPDRWIVTGRKWYNNKGLPVKQYEPFYINTPDFVTDSVLDTLGASSTLFYDPLDRVVKELTPKGYWQTHQWTAWEQVISDEIDTLKDAPYYKANNPDQPNPKSPYYDPNLNEVDKQALKNAIVLSETPSRTILDNLGNTLITEQIEISSANSNKTVLQTHFTHDILGRELTSADPRLNESGLTNFTKVYGLTQQILKVIGADSGTSWGLSNAMGLPYYSQDNRGTITAITFDPLNRPSEKHVKNTANENDPLALNQTVARFIYGDTPGATKNPDLNNLRGQIYQAYDESGLLTTTGYSLLGQPLESQRQFLNDYQNEVNWDDISSSRLKAGLQSTVYTTTIQYDPLSRVVIGTDPDQNETRSEYLLSGRLGQITVTPGDGSAAFDAVKSMIYNAKSQPEQIVYGNGVTSTYQYDLKTWDLINLQSINNSTGSKGTILQNLTYIYDPARNVVQKSDTAQNTVFHANQQVSPIGNYTFDSLYRLITATGREKPGTVQTAGQDIPLLEATSPHPNDNQTLQNYTESFTYDKGNNLEQIQHSSSKSPWTRKLIVSNSSNRAVVSTIKSAASTGSQPTPKEVDQYFDPNGNQITIKQTYPIAWNYRNGLQKAVLVKHDDGTEDTEYYVYDGGGNRTRKITERYGNSSQSVTVSETIYLGTLEIRRTLQGSDPSTASVTKEYHSQRIMNGSQAVATRDCWIVGDPPSGFQTPTLLYSLEDLLNSCSQQIDDQGKLVSTEEYYSYGGSALFIGSGSASQLKHYRYSGQERDSSTGFYYYGARYYAPWLGRWLSPDPAGTVDGLNVYAFVGGNPITHKDIGGLAKKRSKRKAEKISESEEESKGNKEENTKRNRTQTTHYGSYIDSGTLDVRKIDGRGATNRRQQALGGHISKSDNKLFKQESAPSRNKKEWYDNDGNKQTNTPRAKIDANKIKWVLIRTSEAKKGIRKDDKVHEWIALNATKTSASGNSQFHLIHSGHRLADARFWEIGSKSFLEEKIKSKPKREADYREIWGKYDTPGWKEGKKSEYGKAFQGELRNYKFEYFQTNTAHGAEGHHYNKLPPGQKWEDQS